MGTRSGRVSNWTCQLPTVDNCIVIALLLLYATFHIVQIYESTVGPAFICIFFIDRTLFVNSLTHAFTHMAKLVTEWERARVVVKIATDNAVY